MKKRLGIHEALQWNVQEVKRIRKIAEQGTDTSPARRDIAKGAKINKPGEKEGNGAEREELRLYRFERAGAGAEP